MSKPIISVRGLCKDFSVRQRDERRFSGLRSLLSRNATVTEAVRNVDFDIGEGEAVSYLGPNGAGKSTTVKILAGILVPTRGNVEVAGLVPWRNRIRNAENIGVVFGQRTQLLWDLPLIDSLDLARYMYRMPRDRWRSNLAKLRRLLDLDPFLQTPVRQLSLGQRMRGDLAAAMVHEPRVLYLDEPTVGLDLIAKQRIREFLREVNTSTGTTIVLTTHDLDDVEALTRRLMVVNGGRVVFDGDSMELRSSVAPSRIIRTKYASAGGERFIIDPRTPGITLISETGVHAEFVVDTSVVSVADAARHLLSNSNVVEISLHEPRLEDVMREVYAASLTRAVAGSDQVA